MDKFSIIILSCQLCKILDSVFSSEFIYTLRWRFCKDCHCRFILAHHFVGSSHMLKSYSTCIYIICMWHIWWCISIDAVTLYWRWKSMRHRINFPKSIDPNVKPYIFSCGTLILVSKRNEWDQYNNEKTLCPWTKQNGIHHGDTKTVLNINIWFDLKQKNQLYSYLESQCDLESSNQYY